MNECMHLRGMGGKEREREREWIKVSYMCITTQLPVRVFVYFSEPMCLIPGKVLLLS